MRQRALLRRPLLFVLTCLLLLRPGQILQAGTTGKIAGKVTSKLTGEGLPNATVAVQSTGFGVSANLEGDFFITNVPPGTYTVEFSLVGYTKVSVTDVRVHIDQTATVSVALSDTMLEMGTVVVVAERPLIQPEITNKTTNVSGDDILQMPVLSTQDVLSMQPGVVRVRGYLNKIGAHEELGIDQTHVRGGRSGEIAYMIDGMYVEDAIYAGMGTFINRGAVQEMKVEVGGFSAEYGEAQSGVVNIVTREGGTRFSGSLEASTSGWADPDGAGGVAPISKPDALRDFHSILGTLSMPVPFVPNLSLFASAEQSYRKYTVMEFDDITYDPTPITDPTNSHCGWRVGDTLKTYAYGQERFAHPFDRFAGWKAFGSYESRDGIVKLTWHPTTVIKINALLRIADRKFRTYDHYWRYAENARHFVTDNTDQQGITLRHQISSTTFYTINFNRFWKHRTNLIPGLAGETFGPGMHEVDTNGDGIPAPDDPYEWWHYSPFSPDYPRRGWTWGFYDPLEIVGYDSLRGVYVYSGSPTQFWSRNYQQTWGVKADIVSQLGRQHEMKFGMEFRTRDIFFREVQHPYLDNAYFEHFTRHPKEASAYLMDQMDHDRLILNVGVRVDYALSGGWLWSDHKDPTTPLAEAEPRLQFSPRLGFGYRITDAATFHFNYGHFFQVPEYMNLYFGSQRDLSTPRPLIGNPFLDSQKTISYEFGLRYMFSNDWSVDLTAWTKSLTGQSGTVNVQGYDPDSLGAYSYFIFNNYDHGSAKGVDVSIDKRFGRGYGIAVNYTYSVAKANRYYSWTGYWNLHTEETEPKSELLMPYDQTHKLHAILYVRSPMDFGPSIIGFHPFELWFLNFVYSYQSGYPYTPIVGKIPQEPMSARFPARSQLDVVVRRDFSLFRRVRVGLFARIVNLLDQKNVLHVYPETGSPVEPDPSATGPSTSYDRPDFLDLRRQIDLGVRLEF